MAFEFSPHAPVDIDKPEAWGICDRCGFRYHLAALSFQWDWRGNAVQNLRILVCDTCYDTPNEQFRPIIIGPDPVPVQDPRPGWYATQMQGGRPVPIVYGPNPPFVQPFGGLPEGVLLAGYLDPFLVGPNYYILTQGGQGNAMLVAPDDPLLDAPRHEILE